LQLRDHGFDFIELAVWRVLRLLAGIVDEFALVVRRDLPVAAKRSRWAFVTWILRPGLHCRPCLQRSVSKGTAACLSAVRFDGLGTNTPKQPP
jgi:hypothetical protein